MTFPDISHGIDQLLKDRVDGVIYWNESVKKFSVKNLGLDVKSFEVRHLDEMTFFSSLNCKIFPENSSFIESLRVRYGESCKK